MTLHHFMDCMLIAEHYTSWCELWVLAISWCTIWALNWGFILLMSKEKWFYVIVFPKLFGLNDLGKLYTHLSTQLINATVNCFGFFLNRFGQLCLYGMEVCESTLSSKYSKDRLPKHLGILLVVQYITFKRLKSGNVSSFPRNRQCYCVVLFIFRYKGG